MKILIAIVVAMLLSFSITTTAHLKGCYPDLCDPPAVSENGKSDNLNYDYLILDGIATSDDNYCNPYPECHLWPPVASEEINVTPHIMELEKLLESTESKMEKYLAIQRPARCDRDGRCWQCNISGGNCVPVRPPFVFNEVLENRQNSAT